MAATGAAFVCAKCKRTQYETDEFRATGGFFSKMFDIQNKRFHTVSCIQCGYTEVYKGNSSKLGNLFDFFAGG